jgi:hypothetical protein
MPTIPPAIESEVEVVDELQTALLLREMVQLQERQIELAREFGLCFYRPFEKQAKFHSAGWAKFRMMRSGNRFGKSTMGCAEDCAWLLGFRPWIPEGDPTRTIGIPSHGVKGLVITQDWDKVDEIWTSPETGKLFKLLPRAAIKSKSKNHSGATDEVIVDYNGRISVIRFDTVESFKKNPGGAESSDWDFIHIDEPCPELMWKAVSRGLMDRDGKAWFTLTPLSEIWINDFFFPQKPEDKRPSVWSEIGNTRDNPYLTEAAIREYELSLTPEERECRLAGIPLELSGLVYKEFSYATHVLTTLPSDWPSWDRPPSSWSHYAAIDPHPRTPHAVLFIAVGPHGTPIIYDEIFLNMVSTDLAKAVLAKLEGRNYTPVKCDPMAWIEDPITGASLQRSFAEAGLVVHKASKAKEFGILNMRSVFKDPLGVRLVPTVYRTLWELSRYCYDKENKPVDRDDHMMECMYRIFINPPVFAPLESSASIPDSPISHESIHDSWDNMPDWQP